MGNLEAVAFRALGVACVVAMTACTSGASSPDGQGVPDGFGIVRVPLRARAVSGHTYRLRDAVFTVAGEHGEQSLTAEPGAPFAELELPEGSYTVALQPGWHVVQTDEAMGSEAPAQASVQSSEMPLDVRAGHASEARYSFAIVGEGSLVEFGQLLIGVEVVEATGPLSCPACDDGNSCTYDSCDGNLSCTHRPIALGSLCPGGICSATGTCVVASTPIAPLAVLKNYSGRNLNGANFQGADLRRVIFDGASLRGADLAGADLSKASFVGADLRGADLRAAKLEGTNFTGARTTGAKSDLRVSL